MADQERSSAVERIFTTRLKSRREELGLSQSELARQMTEYGHRMHQQTIAKIENCERRVDIAEAEAFAAVLGVPLVDMFTGGWSLDREEVGRRLPEAERKVRMLEDIVTRADQEVEVAQIHLRHVMAARAAKAAELDSQRRYVAFVRGQLGMTDG